MSVLKSLIPRPIKRLARTWIDHLAFERKLRQANPVLVYQMSKVGSLSVHVSLCEQYAGAVVHAHGFDTDYPDRQVRRLHRWLFEEGQPLNVISLTREPVSRNVSSFFQCFEEVTGVPYAESKLSISELQSIFLSRYWHDHALHWFDRHIYRKLRIDVFETPFPAGGFCEYTRGNVRLLVLRSECTNAVKAEAIRAFLGMSSFELRNTNIGDEKDYAATYNSFKKEVKLPIEYIDRQCDSKYFRHFYDEATLAAVRAKWCT